MLLCLALCHPGLALDGYHSLDEIEATLEQAAQDHSDLAVLWDLTERYDVEPTWEGRHLVALRLGSQPEGSDQPSALIVAAHHAKEIGTPLVALDAIEQLVEGYGADPEVTALLDDWQVIVAPVWNPDGRQYVFDSDPDWRKNRRPLEGTAQVGVDLNRNYPFGWDDGGCAGSTDPGDTKYKGEEPGSEAEVITMMALAADLNPAKVLDIHSFGRSVKWGYSCRQHPFDAYLQATAEDVSLAWGYDGATSKPTSEGEHAEWELARGSLAFLVEVGTEHQPPVEDMLAEAEDSWPGVLEMLRLPVPLSGHVVDAETGEGLAAEAWLTDVAFASGETLAVQPATGRFHLWAPEGGHVLHFSADGHRSRDLAVELVEGEQIELDVDLEPCRWCREGCATAGGPTGLGWLGLAGLLRRRSRRSPSR